jgi:hypothetical protein
VGQQFALGSVVGTIVGLWCWRGNQTLQVVSTFPDLFTFLLLAVLLAATIRFMLRRSTVSGLSASLRVGVTVAAAAGAVFGSTVVGLGLLRFSNPAPMLLMFGFFTAFGSALSCGVVAAMAGTTHRERVT